MMLMDISKCIQYFLSLVYLVQFAACVTEVPLRELGSSLIFQSYLSINLPTFYQCLELCVAFKLCRNFSFSNGECLLNSDDMDRQYLWMSLVPRKSTRKKDIPQDIGGACREHSCAIDEMCIPTGQAYFCIKHDYPTVRCPLSWGHAGDLCFTVSSSDKTWMEAKDHCASTGAELLTFDSSDEYILHKTWILYMVEMFTRNQIKSGKVWTGLTYSPPTPFWMDFIPPETDSSNLCMAMRYNRTGEDIRTLQVGIMEAVSCNEKHGVACQHRNPDYWP